MARSDFVVFICDFKLVCKSSELFSLQISINSSDYFDDPFVKKGQWLGVTSNQMIELTGKSTLLVILAKNQPFEPKKGVEEQGV